MAGVLRSDRGGIASLRRLIAEHPEALHYELLKLGLRLEHLGTRRLTWFDVKAIVLSLPPGSALHRVQNPDDAAWDLHAQLLAGAVDALNAGNWQRAGDKNARQPDPVRRATADPVKVPTAAEKAALNALLPAQFRKEGVT